MARVNRWPVAECLHEHTTTTELRQGLGTLLRRTERAVSALVTAIVTGGALLIGYGVERL